MDRSTSDKDKSSKRSRDDRDRDSGRDHREREHKHRSRDKDRESTSHHHHHRSERDDHNRDRDYHRKSSSKREDREGSRDRDIKRERSVDLRDDREGSRERVERSHERRKRDERERSHDGRDEREGSRDRHEKPREREVKRERSYDGRENEELDDVNRRKRKDREGSGDEREKKEAKVSVVKRERRKFGDKVKEEIDVDHAPDNVNRVDISEIKVKEEVIEEPIAGGSTINGGVSAVNGAASGSLTEPSSIAGSSVPSHFSDPSKVSSISNTNENKGVSVTRSHEVPGKSSTDGTSSIAGKSGKSSFDLAKAKNTVEMKKDIRQKLERMRMLNKAHNSSSGGAALSGAKDGVKVPSSSAGVSATATATPMGQAASGMPPIPGLNSIPNYEAVRRAQELAAKMGFRQDPEFGPLINLFPGQMQTEVAVPQKPTKAPVLRVDALGREIDEHGNVVNVTKPSNLSTLKVNINKQKKDAFQILKPELEVDPESNPHFDARMGIDKVKLLRPKRMAFQFVEEGKWSKDAETIKLRNQFGEERARDMKARQALHAKAKAAPDINPNLIEVGERAMTTKEKAKDPIPEIEWWDVSLLVGGAYGEFEDGVVQDNQLKMEKITIYVEHPRPIEPPAEPAPPPPQPLKLTKREQKKLRTQRRLAREKDRQEMIRQGLLEPPKPKVKMSNLMRVLGSEATQDPTKLEKEVRSAAAEREQAHIDRNIARKLTPSERREKKERKLFDDPNTVGTMVSVYRVNDLSHKKTRFKVDVNASHNHMTGCCVITEGINVVVVEGGSKSNKRYGNLMLRRINWAEAVNDEEDEEGGGGGDEDKPPNKCVLVWQGIVAKPSFNRFTVHECMTEAAARKIFADAGVVQYWDLAVNFSDDME
ncbi:Protein RDM16 [Linum perenne]